jgi:hypothetical protein
MRQKADIDLEDRVLAGNEIHGIEESDDDDFRILDSLPTGGRKVVDSKESQFCKHLKEIEVVAFNTVSIPAITNLTYFMNKSFFLKEKGHDSL